MTMFKNVVVILFLVYSGWISQSISLLQKNLVGNLFHEINVDMQNAINSIFKLLQLNNNFTSIHKHRLLLSMHATMKSIAERNYPRYKDVKRAAKLFLKSKPKDGLFNLDKLINILVQEKLTPGNMTMFSDKPNKTAINLQITSYEIPEDEEESLAFLKEYLNNLDDSYNFDSPLQKIKNEFEKNKDKVKARRKLKTWKASHNTTVEAQTNSTNFRRIFQGTKVTIKQFPFLVSVHVNDKLVCAGSIINKLTVITAATCLQSVFYDGKTDVVTVRIGSDHTETQGNLCNISRIFFHPQYNFETLENNLAILKIKKELILTSKPKLRRVEYQRMEGSLHSSVRDIVIVGWGDTNTDSNGKEPLAYSHLDVYNLQRCIETYTSKFVNEKNFCAGFTSIGAGACQRDIGGPAIVGNVLVGVVSFGPPVCGTEDAPTVFTNLGNYIEWIDSVLRQLPVSIPAPSAATVTYLKMRVDTLNSSPSEAKIKTTRQPPNPTKPLMKLRSNYPKSIQVLTYLLNELLVAGKNVDDLVFGEDDKDNENVDKQSSNTSDSLRYGLVEATTPIERFENLKETPRTYESTISTFKYHTVTPEYEDQESYEEPAQLSQNIETEDESTSTVKREIKELTTTPTTTRNRKNVVTQTLEPMPEHLLNNYASDQMLLGINPLYIAIKGLQGYLGLNKAVKFSEVSDTDTEETEESFESINVKNTQNVHVNATNIKNKTYSSTIGRSFNNTGTGSDKTINQNTYNNINKPRVILRESTTAVPVNEGTRILTNTSAPLDGNTDDDKYSDSNVSDNYEDEKDDGLSIEISHELNIPPSLDNLNVESLSSLINYQAKHHNRSIRPTEFEKKKTFDSIFKQKKSRTQKKETVSQKNKILVVHKTTRNMHTKKHLEPIYEITAPLESNDEDISRFSPPLENFGANHRSHVKFTIKPFKHKTQKHQKRSRNNSSKNRKISSNNLTNKQKSFNDNENGDDGSSDYEHQLYANRAMITMLHGYETAVDKSDIEIRRRFLDYINIK